MTTDAITAKTTAPATLPITQNALIKRIKRRLAHEGQTLHTPRGRAGNADLGEFYIVDLHSRVVVAGHQDLEKLGRELGVLRPEEKFAEVEL